MTLTFDLHDAAYYAWRDAGVRGATLIHVDAHHDAAANPEWLAIDIGNFVRAAVREGIVADVRWVVPDPMWSDATTRDLLRREIDDVSGADLRLWYGPLAEVGPGRGPLLLDLDADYLLTTRYEERRAAEPLDMPWCWPDALAASIRALNLAPMITTVAASVTGGFTPLRWAHLARELSARLDGTAVSRAFDYLRLSAEAEWRADSGAALAACRAAVAADAGEAAAHYHLALALQRAGSLSEARAALARARAIDPSYSTPFATRGPYLYRRRRLDEAAAAYRAALELDPADPHAQLGLAMIAARDERFEEALRLALMSLDGNPGAVDAWRVRGNAAARLGRPRDAINAYQRALALALRGAAPLGGPWASNPQRRLIDPRHWDDHAALAALHAALGDEAAARTHRRMADAGAAVLGS